MTPPLVPPRNQWPTHLQLRGSRFYARVRIPPGLGLRSTHLQQSLHTSRYAEAVKRLPVVVAELRLELERKRLKEPKPQPVADLVDREAAWWRERIERMGRRPEDGIPDELEMEWESAIERRLGPVVDEEEGVPVHAGDAEAKRLLELVYGTLLPVDAELERFIAEKGMTPRYADRIRRAVRRLKAWMEKRYRTDDLRRVTRRDAGEFVDHLLQSGLATPTANSMVSSLGVYWTWLGARVGVEGNPWTNQTRRERPTDKVAAKRPFTDDEVKRLLHGPATPMLRDLMKVAALTGMRIDEIARLTVADAADGLFRIGRGKTEASVRDVPIHSDLKGLVQQRSAGKEGAARLFHELKAPPSRKKELSAKASERFTAYRRAVGVDERAEGQRQSNIDFHSFRRWFITKAEEAGQPPHVISAVVGHTEGRKGMTLGVYSGGPSLEQKRSVVESVTLPLSPG